MKRCKRCILPETYAGLTFDHKGICNYCKAWKDPQYEGEGKLIELIKSMRANSKYDCAIGFSGGRDSTYLLYYASKILKLKVIAFTIDNGFMSKEAIRNVHNIVQKMQVDHVIQSHDYLKKAFPKNIRTWLKKPDPAMLIALCNGCRYGYSKGIYQLMKKHGCNVYLDGNNPFELNPYKTKLLSMKPSSNSKIYLFFGAMAHIFRNLSWVTNPYNAYVFYSDFMSYIGKKYKKKMEKEGMLYISPFLNYIKWEEKNMEYVLDKELNWENKDRGTSSWRTDCQIAPLKLHLCKKSLDYSDKDALFSALIRDKQISREEALARIDSDNRTSLKDINEFLKKFDLSIDE